MGMMDQRLSLITLGVSNLARAKAFYCDGLGWEPHAASQKSVLFFQLPGIALAIWNRDELAKDAGIENTDTGFSGISLAYNAPSPKDVDDVLKQVQNAGANITKSGCKTPWGGYSGYFTDPDGHLWEVAHNPFWTIRDDGSIELGVPA